MTPLKPHWNSQRVQVHLWTAQTNLRDGSFLRVLSPHKRILLQLQDLVTNGSSHILDKNTPLEKCHNKTAGSLKFIIKSGGIIRLDHLSAVQIRTNMSISALHYNEQDMTRYSYCAQISWPWHDLQSLCENLSFTLYNALSSIKWSGDVLYLPCFHLHPLTRPAHHSQSTKLVRHLDKFDSEKRNRNMWDRYH